MDHLEKATSTQNTAHEQAGWLPADGEARGGAKNGLKAQGGNGDAEGTGLSWSERIRPGRGGRGAPIVGWLIAIVAVVAAIVVGLGR